MTEIETIRPWCGSDDVALRCVLEAQMRADAAWPPGYARGGDIVQWLGAPATLGRWVAVDVGGSIVGHVGIAPVHSGPLADIWVGALGCQSDAIAEVCRLVVDESVRRHGVSGRLTRHAVRATIQGGRIPVAYALADRSASIAMMVNIGWRVVATACSPQSHHEIVVLVPPQKLVDAARSMRTCATRVATP